MMVGTMKSENSNFSSSTEAGEKILSRFLSVDELLIRPSADMTIDTLAGDDESKKSNRASRWFAFKNSNSAFAIFQPIRHPMKSLPESTSTKSDGAMRVVFSTWVLPQPQLRTDARSSRGIDVAERDAGA